MLKIFEVLKVIIFCSIKNNSCISTGHSLLKKKKAATDDTDVTDFCTLKCRLVHFVAKKIKRITSLNHFKLSDDRFRFSEDCFKQSDDRFRQSDDRFRDTEDHFRDTEDRFRAFF